MTWHSLSTNPRVVEDLYGDAPPTLRGCWLYLLVLNEEHGGSLTVGLSTKRMPERCRWPGDWGSESNRVTLGLTFAGLSSLQVDGWSIDNVVAEFNVCRADDGRSVALRLSGSWGHVAARSDRLTLSVHAKQTLEGPENPYGH